MDKRLGDVVIDEYEDEAGAAHADPGYGLDGVEVCGEGVAHVEEEPGH